MRKEKKMKRIIIAFMVVVSMSFANAGTAEARKTTPLPTPTPKPVVICLYDPETGEAICDPAPPCTCDPVPAQ